MPFKSGINKGKLTRQELIDEYGDNFKKIRGFWSRGDIISKLHAMGVGVKFEDPPELVVEPEPELEPEPEPEPIVEEPKPEPKKRGRKKKSDK